MLLAIILVALSVVDVAVLYVISGETDDTVSSGVAGSIFECE